MPVLTRWFVKAALLYLIIALLAELAIATNNLGAGNPFISSLGPVYFHLFLVGWVSQLIFGVVFWMFPKYSIELPRGYESIGWATFWLINIGLVLRAIGEPLQATNPGSGSGWLLAVSAFLQWIAGILFVFNTWARVKEK